MLFAVVRDTVENAAQLRFERQASDAKSVIEDRIQYYPDILYGLKALFAGQGPVSRLQFHRYVESLDLKNRYPGFDVVNYAVRVAARDKRDFEESVRRDTSLDPIGYPEFAIRPPGDRPEYYVVAYVEPMSGFEFSFGLDLAANPEAKEPELLVAALRSARDSGKLTASGVPLRIQGAKPYTGLAMRLAVYDSGRPVSTVQQRQAAYLGSVGAGFNVDKLMKGVLDAETARYMRFRLYDAGPANNPSIVSSSPTERLLFNSYQPAANLSHPSSADDLGAMFNRILAMEVGGRIWNVHISAPRSAVINRVDALLSWTVLGGGLLSSLLLFGLTYSLASSRDRAVEIANEMTKDLRVSTEQLTAMSRRLVEVQEGERRQLSRELHDRIGQNLTALSINLDILSTQLPGGGSAEYRSRLADAAALLESTTGAVENVMSELRPPMLDDYGLLPALQWYGSQFSSRTGIRVEVNGDEQAQRLPSATEIALFRIAQEALNNVAKHAHARTVDVKIERSGAEWIMSVADDGTGFDTDQAANSRRRSGLGMVTMRERTQAIGGRFEAGAAPGGGAQIMVRIPC